MIFFIVLLSILALMIPCLNMIGTGVYLGYFDTGIIEHHA